jgi:hypothetical protein
VAIKRAKTGWLCVAIKRAKTSWLCVALKKHATCLYSFRIMFCLWMFNSTFFFKYISNKYRGSQFYWCMKPEYLVKNYYLATSYSQTLLHNVLSSTPLPWTGIELAMFVVIVTGSLIKQDSCIICNT